VGVLESNVGILESNVGILESNVGILESNVGILESDVGILESNIANLSVIHTVDTLTATDATFTGNVVIQSSNGVQYYLEVADDGTLSTTAVV
jgi:hypothetical protein